MLKRDLYALIFGILVFISVVFYDIIHLMIIFIYKQESYMKTEGHFLVERQDTSCISPSERNTHDHFF